MIRIRSVFDIKAFKAFQNYSLKKVFVLAYICTIILVGIGIYFVFTARHYMIYFIAGIMLPICMHLFSRIHEIDAINRNIYLRDTTMQIFTFNEEDIEFEQISKIDTFNDRYEYKQLLSAVKYKKYYFLYVNRAQAFIVKSEDYVNGTEEELDELFKNVFGKKFIVKWKRKKRVETTKK